MTTNANPLRDLIRDIVFEMMAEWAAAPTADHSAPLGPDDGQNYPDVHTQRRDHIAAALTVPAPLGTIAQQRQFRAEARTIGAVRRAPQRTATPAHYRPTRFGASAAGQKMVASLTPRLATTFKAIARRKTGMSRPDVSGATGTTPKQAENNVYGLQKLELIETFYPDAK